MNAAQSTRSTTKYKTSLYTSCSSVSRSYTITSEHSGSNYNKQLSMEAEAPHRGQPPSHATHTQFTRHVTGNVR